MDVARAYEKLVGAREREEDDGWTETNETKPVRSHDCFFDPQDRKEKEKCC